MSACAFFFESAICTPKTVSRQHALPLPFKNTGKCIGVSSSSVTTGCFTLLHRTAPLLLLLVLRFQFPATLSGCGFHLTPLEPMGLLVELNARLCHFGRFFKRLNTSNEVIQIPATRERERMRGEQMLL